MKKGIGLLLIALVAILTALLVIQHLKIRKMQRQLDGITIYDAKGDSLKTMSASGIKDSMVVLTPEFVDRMGQYQSPFLDGKKLIDLVPALMRERTEDDYGAPRRSDELRRIHEGIDLFVPENTPVYPIAPVGIVTEVSHNPDHLILTSGKTPDNKPDTISVSYGKIVRVMYPEGIESLYAHLNEINVVPGQIVYGNTKLGVTGFTGNIKSSGKPSHLHLEIRKSDNKSIDPKTRLYFSAMDYKRFIQAWTKAVKLQKKLPPLSVQKPVASPAANNVITPPADTPKPVTEE